jgi:hypothetical protein
MESLFHEVGLPPYRLDQILPLIDKASSLISHPREASTQSHDTAVQIAESMEALAWLVENHMINVFPQYLQKQELLENGPCLVIHVPSNDKAYINSIATKTLQLKGWLFDGFHQVPEISCSGLNTAQLCQFCHWPFQRLSKGPNHVNYEYLRKSPWFLDNSPHYLLAMDSWPAFHVLEERSQQGCDLCRFLREQLLALSMQRPERPERPESERMSSVWIEFHWSEGPRSLKHALKVVKVVISGYYGHESLRFTVHTAQGELGRYDLRL